ncbi:MAG TPA: hypothetical protein VKQ30_21780 [Ktedonobacterales bacterium]|nr:hypothetical protein [Ktedonobacterales bacterium]
MAVRLNAPTGERPPLITEKIAAFDAMRAEFESCFAYVVAMHGQKRFSEVTVGSTVLYLHALWICDCKDHLLSVPRTTGRYEGRRCLELLRDWQHGETAAVIWFLQQKLDLVDFAGLTRQRQEAIGAGKMALAERLSHGRAILMDRGSNLHTALEAIFALPDDELMHQVRAACVRYGHTPDEIPAQLAAYNNPTYSYVPHPHLAQHNMLVMNMLGVRVMADPADLPGHRTMAVEVPDLPAAPYAQEVIAAEMDLSGLWHNNPAARRLANPPAANPPPANQPPAVSESAAASS